MLAGPADHAPEMEPDFGSPAPAVRTTQVLRPPDWRAVRAAVTMAIAYYLGVKVGLVLTAATSPVSVLWPPNALLFGALLLAPTRWWWILLAAAFPAHVLAEVEAGLPIVMVLAWFASNVSEALIGASLVRWLAGGRKIRLDTVRSVAGFVGAAVVASVLSSFLDAAFVRLNEWAPTGYWTLWWSRVWSNVLATLTFTSVMVVWTRGRIARLRGASHARLMEAAVLLAGLVTVSVVAFGVGRIVPEQTARSLLYLPVPFLMWAAVRFGPALACSSFAVVTFLVIWGTADGRGPFGSALAPEDALPIQLFLVTLAIPQMLLAAVIEERRRTERRLAASEELFATAFHDSPDAIAICSAADGTIIQVNRRWLDLLRYERREAEPISLAPLGSHLEPADRERLAALVREGAELRDVEVLLRDCSGKTRNALVAMSALRLQGRDCLLYVVRDITQQRLAELDAREQRDHVAHLSRVASLSDLSTTLAHELNQPLSAILNYAQAALRFVSYPPHDMTQIRVVLDEIVAADRRASTLIRNLRRMMKKGGPQFAALDLNRLVEDVRGFVRGEFAQREVQASFNLAPDLPPVQGDAIQLQQLVLNLVSNACDAMAAIDAPRRLSVATLAGRGGGVQLLVADEGPGIPAGHSDRIFEPFFTTKEDGLGMGLSICRQIALAHGGTLHAEPNGERGTCFRLVLPGGLG